VYHPLFGILYIAPPNIATLSSVSHILSFYLSGTDENVVEGNVDELDDVSNCAHDDETDADSLADLDELLLVGLLALVHELDTILDKLHGHVNKLLHLVGHFDGL
jgi:hypothetical protein